MRRAIAIGSPGAGKSTFARKLRDKTGLPLYYLDMLWHRPDRTTVSREEFDARLEEILKGDRWILDGNFQRTLEARLRACDTVFLLDLPLEVCLSSVEGRVGQVREDMPWVEEEFDPEFRQWIQDFPQTHRPKIYELLEKYRNDRDIVIFQSRKEMEDYLYGLANEKNRDAGDLLPGAPGGER